MLLFADGGEFHARLHRKVMARTWTTAFFSVCLLGIPAVAQGPQKATLSLHGTVINSVTQQPIGRAQVYSSDNRLAAMTDDQGHFEFASPENENSENNNKDQPGIVNLVGMLTARKPGFLVNQGRDVLRISESGEVTIELTPEALIIGRIRLSNGDSSDGIRVQLFRQEVRDGIAHWFPAESFNTNSNGEFRFAELAAGNYRIGTQEAPDRDPGDFTPGGKVYGYPPVYFPGSSTFSNASTIRLNSGQIFQADFSLARRQYFPVKIAIANAPAATGFNINVSLQGDGSPGYSLGQGPQQTIIGSLPDGNYVVEVSTYGPEAASWQLNVTVANAPVEGERLALLRNFPISVQVDEEFTTSGASVPPSVVVINGSLGPRRDLNVTLSPISEFGRGDYASLQPPTNPNDKSMVLTPVRRGSYWVQVTSQRGYAASITSGGTDLLLHPLIVGAGGSTPPIAITLRDDFAFLEGTVEGVASRTSTPGATLNFAPAAYVYCVPQSDSSGQFTQLSVSPDGKVNSPPMPPGIYRVLAFQHPQENFEYRNPEAMRMYESRGPLVHLAPGQKETVDLQLITNADENAE